MQQSNLFLAGEEPIEFHFWIWPTTACDAYLPGHCVVLPRSVRRRRYVVGGGPVMNESTSGRGSKLEQVLLVWPYIYLAQPLLLICASTARNQCALLLHACDAVPEQAMHAHVSPEWCIASTR